MFKIFIKRYAELILHVHVLLPIKLLQFLLFFFFFSLNMSCATSALQ